MQELRKSFLVPVFDGDIWKQNRWKQGKQETKRPLFISKITIFLLSTILSISAMALDFNQTQRLAKQGHAIDQYNHGYMYTIGDGVRQDYIKARYWFEKANNQEDAKAQYNLGMVCHKGEGVHQDYTKAA